MVYVITQTPHFGFYPEMQQYINAPHAAHRTSATARGLNGPNESFRYPLSSSSLVTYSAWCADLAAKGTKMIRVIWGARHMTRNPVVCDLEPPPYGTYNIWHSALDDSTLATFRSHQVSGSPGDGTFPQAYWDNSNVKALLDACQANGIEVWIALSHNKEWTGYEWTYHPWNYGNYYLNGTRCENADRGFLSERWQVYTDAQAIQAMKDRITFVIDLVGGYKCVTLWGICSEGNWGYRPSVWGEDSFNSTMIDNVRNYVSPWYETIGKHIRSEDAYNRPIVSSIMQVPSTYTWPSSADDPRNVKTEPLTQYPMDIVAVNLYGNTYEDAVRKLNAAREKVDPKLVAVHQYWPQGWILGDTSPLRIEEDPYLDSKYVEWLGAVMKWSIGPGRWMGLEESSHNVWIRGGYADPDWYGIGAVTETFRGDIDWKEWSGAEPWEDYVSSVGLDYSITTGDGDHFAGMLVWTSSGAKSLTVSNVTNGDWTVIQYDWTTGNVDATFTPTAAGNAWTIAPTTNSENRIVLYGSLGVPSSSPSASASPSESPSLSPSSSPSSSPSASASPSESPSESPSVSPSAPP